MRIQFRHGTTFFVLDSGGTGRQLAPGESPPPSDLGAPYRRFGVGASVVSKRRNGGTFGFEACLVPRTVSELCESPERFRSVAQVRSTYLRTGRCPSGRATSIFASLIDPRAGTPRDVRPNESLSTFSGHMGRCKPDVGWTYHEAITGCSW